MNRRGVSDDEARGAERRAWARALRSAGAVGVRIAPTLRLGPAGAATCDVAVTDGAGGGGRVRLALCLAPAERDRLLPPCAAAEVPEVWVTDAPRGLLERYWAPAGGRYRRRELYFPGERLRVPGGDGWLAVPGRA